VNDRFPYEALIAVAGDPDVSALARRLGVTRRTVHRWAHDGLVPAKHADRIAIRLGLA
jgi:hypothetical protein